MGLVLPQKIEMTVSSNLHYFENKGYDIPKKICTTKARYGQFVYDMGAIFEVDVLDLEEGSDKKVICNCDGCKKNFSIEYRSYNKYKKFDGSIYCCHCAGIFRSGELSGRWNNNLTQLEREKKRKNYDYYIFYHTVLKRDKYICVNCGKKTRDLNVHHLNSYDWDRDNRTNPLNGITLCENCHKNFHSNYGYGNNTKEQFDEWLDRCVELDFDKNIKINTTKEVICLETKEIFESAKVAACKVGANESSIRVSCNNDGITYNGLHYMYLQEYNMLSGLDINKKLSFSKYKRKKVLCLNNGHIYNSTNDAEQTLNTGKRCVGSVCRGSRKYTYSKVLNTNAHFIFLINFYNLSPEDQQLIKDQYFSTWDNDSFLFAYFNSIT